MTAKSVTDQDFDAEVLRSPVPVLVDFWAPRCGPCVAMAPMIDSLATELAGEVKVVKVNVDDARDVAMRYGIATLPTLLIFRAGRVRDQLVGARRKHDIVDAIEAHLG